MLIRDITQVPIKLNLFFIVWWSMFAELFRFHALTSFWYTGPSPVEKHVYPIPQDELLPLDYKGVWESMEECQRLGLTKSIGVSNFSIKKLELETILSFATIPPSVNQVSLSLPLSFTCLNIMCSFLADHGCDWKLMICWGGDEPCLATEEVCRILQGQGYYNNCILSLGSQRVQLGH